MQSGRDRETEVGSGSILLKTKAAGAQLPDQVDVEQICLKFLCSSAFQEAEGPAIEHTFRKGKNVVEIESLGRSCIEVVFGVIVAISRMTRWYAMGLD